MSVSGTQLALRVVDKCVCVCVRERERERECVCVERVERVGE